MLGPITWLGPTRLETVERVESRRYSYSATFHNSKMSEANFNVNLPIRESDDDMSSAGITE